ncbi:uncharacterized protein [Garra rufa]
MQDCQKILTAAKADFLRIRGNLLKGGEVSGAEKTLYRYYCEAVLVFRHLQGPGAVEVLTDADWVERLQHGGRVVFGISSRATARKQAPTFALSSTEEAWFQLYFREIRPENIRPDKTCNRFFMSPAGEGVCNVTKDLNRLHEMYKLPAIRSNDMRKAVEAAAAQTLPADQQQAVKEYLTLRVPAAKNATATVCVLLDSLAGFTSDDGTPGTSTENRDFSAFVSQFPV